MLPFLENKAGRLVVRPTIVKPYPAHLHPETELLYVFEGEADIMVDNQPQHLAAGDLCVCFPGVVHSYVGNQNARAVMVIFRPEIATGFPALLASALPKDPVVRQPYLPEDVAFCMQQILQEHQDAGNEQVLLGYIRVVLARTLPLLTLSSRAPELSDIMYSILKYLSAHYREPITLHHLSRALGVSKSHLSHTFSRRIGVSFRTYINLLRLYDACTRLTTTNESIMNIAMECGFESYRTFDRIFVQQYGIAPKVWRRQNALKELLWIGR